MKLNHINLILSNVAKGISFFETYFGFTCAEVKGDHIVAVLMGSDGFTLVLMANKEGDPVYPHAFHIGFMQDNEEQVNAIYQKLKDGGIEVGNPPKKIRDSFGFYFNYEILMIEVGYYFTENL